MPLGPAQSSKKSSQNRVRMANRFGTDLPFSPTNVKAPPAAAVVEPVESVAPGGADAASSLAFARSAYDRIASGPAWQRSSQHRRSLLGLQTEKTNVDEKCRLQLRPLFDWGMK